MLVNCAEPAQKYEDVKEQAFQRYNRKIEAIILNLNSNSLKESDKTKIKKQLAQKLLGSIR